VRGWWSCDGENNKEIRILTKKEKKLIEDLIKESLDLAEKHWKNGGYLLKESAMLESIGREKYESEPSKIPGHLEVQDRETKIDEFIALVVDMRDSSKHLMEDISSKTSNVTMLQRVYYEISALLPAVEQTIKFGKGSVTEYLGDGVLAFFKVNEENNQETIRKVYNVAENIMDDTLSIVNNILNQKYGLPPLEIGIGLSMSNALVTLMGLSGSKHPKAFGTCVFKATKLSIGRNEILTDKWLKDSWPSSSGGNLKFIKSKKVKVVDGYIIERGSR